MNAVIFEVSLVVHSILIYQFSISIFQVVLHHAFIATAIIIILDNEDATILLGRYKLILAEMVFGGNDVLMKVATIFLSITKRSLNLTVLFFSRLLNL